MEISNKIAEQRDKEAVSSERYRKVMNEYYSRGKAIFDKAHGVQSAAGDKFDQDFESSRSK